jgi:hypothetical protein
MYGQALNTSYDIRNAIRQECFLYSKDMPGACRICVSVLCKTCTLQGTSLPNLVPRFISLTCPQLAQLTIAQPRRIGKSCKPVFVSEPADAVPLALCSSLKQLMFDVHWQKLSPMLPPTAFNLAWKPQVSETSLQLPTAYHTPVEMLHKLPNIDTLVFKDAPNAALKDTFPTQLTRLEIKGDPSSVEQSIKACSKLQHLRIKTLMLPGCRDSLRVLHLCSGVNTDEQFQMLLGLPRLSRVRLGVLWIYEDWSSEPCSWQELHIEQLPCLTSLANLNLSSIRKLSTGADAVSTA